jgi:hypothetical protein
MQACMLDADFIGIKLGDLNGTAKLAASAAGDWPVIIDNQQLQSGNSYLVPVRGSDMERLSGFQFDLGVDLSAVELVAVRPGLLTADHVGGSRLRNGRVTVSWNQQQLPVIGDAELFTLVLRAKANTTLGEVLRIREDWLQAESYDQRRLHRSVDLQIDAMPAIGFEVFQNTPNPFVEQTNIGFHLPAAGQVLLRISDVNGRTVYQTEGDFPAGYQQFVVDGADIPGGVFYYTVQSEGMRLTRKLVHAR